MYSILSGHPFKSLKACWPSLQWDNDTSICHTNLSVHCSSWYSQMRFVHFSVNTDGWGSSPRLPDSGGDIKLSHPRLCSTWKRHTHTQSIYTPTYMCGHAIWTAYVHTTHLYFDVNMRVEFSKAHSYCFTVNKHWIQDLRMYSKGISISPFGCIVADSLAGKTVLTWVHPN